MVKRADQEAARRPPSTPGLSRRSGRIPALPYPPIKPLHCTAIADMHKRKSSTLEENSAKSQGVWGACVREDLMDLLIERNQLG